MARASHAAGYDTAACVRTLLRKQAIPLGLLLLLGFAMLQQSRDLDLTAAMASAGAISPGQWLTAGLASLASFLAFGRFERIMHRLTGSDVPGRYAGIAGMTAVAAAQLTGFGLLVATLARWRMFPDLTLWQAMRLTATVSAGFLLALAVLALAALTVAPLLPVPWRLLCGSGLLLALGAALATLWPPRVLWRLNLPPLRAQFALLAWTAADTAFAALAFYVLLPADLLPSPVLFYAVFLLALGAGLVGATPGGIGPFEMLCLACLPALPEADLLAAIMGFRLVYYALPAACAFCILIAAPTLRRSRAMLGAADPPAVTAPVPPVRAAALSYTASRAETGLIRQGDLGLLSSATSQPLGVAAEAGQSLVMLFDPLDGRTQTVATLAALDRAARRRGRLPCLYKCSARTAAAARRMGWHVLPVGHEARLDPRDFDPGARTRRQMRRQMRKAEAAGVTIRLATGAGLPLAEMARVASAWEAARGPARGFSMGRFGRAYVAGQTVALACSEGRLVAFATFHASHAEYALDLVCHTPDAPPGTMHLLVARAIDAAASDGCRAFSLAGVPRDWHLDRPGDWPLPARLSARIRRLTGTEGLRRFKSSFGPRWEPRYIAAPSRPALLLAAIDLADRITRPRDLPEHEARL